MSYDEVYRETVTRVTKDFNFLDLSVALKALDHELRTFIEKPSGALLTSRWLSERGDKAQLLRDHARSVQAEPKRTPRGFFSWLQDACADEIEAHWMKQDHYPLCSILFETRDAFMSRWIAEHVDDLYKIGLGVILPPDASGLSSLLFIPSTGHDFYDAHWMPLYTHLLGWVDSPELVATPATLSTVPVTA